MLISLFGLYTSLISSSFANCPTDETIQGNLTCSSTFNGQVDFTEASHLGGECSAQECYTCGEPYANEKQIAPEAVYTFKCQRTGDVVMEISNLPCDLDIYVLDDTCDPYNGCLQGSTQPYNASDFVEFQCVSGQNYYIVVEAYGTNHLANASGPCTDDGTSTGNVFSPTYTLSFDVSQSTGCAEDCDNGIDDDLDGITDCSDPDCWSEALCCDIDGDGVFADSCLGSDCDDSDPSVYLNAPEDGGTFTNMGDGIDNDCDGLIDEGMLNYDDDGDGYSEVDGDCNDNNPNIHPGATELVGNNLDDDCDGLTDAGTDSTDDDGDGFSELDGDCDDNNANVNPNVEEIADNGIDDNCNGEIDEIEETAIPNKDGEMANGCNCQHTGTSLPSSAFFFTLLLPFFAYRRRN